MNCKQTKWGLKNKKNANYANKRKFIKITIIYISDIYINMK